jgi:HEAT repeat protein
VPWLSELALTHQDREVRGGAALALARTGTPAARDVLRRALEGDMASLEYSLVRAAGEAADAALLPRLIEIARGHPAWNMRAVAAAGVGRVDSTEARGALAGILGREKQPAVLERIVEASSAAWDAAFVPGLTSVAEREEESISSELRIRAIRALARIPGPEARAALEKLLALERRRGVLSRDRTVMSEISAALGIAVC